MTNIETELLDAQIDENIKNRFPEDTSFPVMNPATYDVAATREELAQALLQCLIISASLGTLGVDGNDSDEDILRAVAEKLDTQLCEWASCEEILSKDTTRIIKEDAEEDRCFKNYCAHRLGSLVWNRESYGDDRPWLVFLDCRREEWDAIPTAKKAKFSKRL